MAEITAFENIEDLIIEIRGQEVLLDSDVTKIYEAVKNNPEKFPEDFWFELNDEEFKNLWSKFSTLKSQQRGK